MPSMKCHECKKVAKCTAVAARDENDKVVLIYLCATDRREWVADRKESDDSD